MHVCEGLAFRLSSRMLPSVFPHTESSFASCLLCVSCLLFPQLFALILIYPQERRHTCTSYPFYCKHLQFERKKASEFTPEMMVQPCHQKSELPVLLFPHLIHTFPAFPSPPLLCALPPSSLLVPGLVVCGSLSPDGPLRSFIDDGSS